MTRGGKGIVYSCGMSLLLDFTTVSFGLKRYIFQLSDSITFEV